MLISHSSLSTAVPLFLPSSTAIPLGSSHGHASYLSYPPLSRLSLRSQTPTFAAKPQAARGAKSTSESQEVEVEIVAEDDLEDEREQEGEAFPFVNGFGEDEGDGEEGFSNSSAYGGKRDEKDYDRDPELAEILGSCFDDPQKAQNRVEDRIRRKRDKILHTKTGSAIPMKVVFNKFDFSNSYIWFEFYNAPLPKDVSLVCDIIRSWHIIGRLGGCNSMNMQLSQSPLDNKRPTYDAIQGANVNPTTFYNIGDLEIQENIARIWVDIGITEPLLLDVLINALTCLSSDYIGIKQMVFGGSEFENWKEHLTSEEAVCTSYKI